MSVKTLLKVLRHGKTWTPEARMLYTTRRFIAFFETYPDLISIACSNAPDNRVLWDGFFRFFYRHFPARTDTYFEYGKEQRRPWWYNEEVFDPKWDRLMQVHKAGRVYDTIIRPYLKHKSES
jgi:hypothetical protein